MFRASAAPSVTLSGMLIHSRWRSTATVRYASLRRNSASATFYVGVVE
jgi:hypothetical protein